MKKNGFLGIIGEVQPSKETQMREKRGVGAIFKGDKKKWQQNSRISP